MKTIWSRKAIQIGVICIAQLTGPALWADLSTDQHNDTLTNGTSSTVVVTMDVGPNGATNGGGFRLSTGPTNIYFQHGNISVGATNSVTLVFKCIPGFAVPPPQVIQVQSNNVTLVLDYLPPPPYLPSLYIVSEPNPANNGVIFSNGVPQYTFDIDYTPGPGASAAWSALTTLVVANGGAIFIPDPTPRTGQRLYRASWVTCPPR